jgi:hypothetical protein
MPMPLDTLLFWSGLALLSIGLFVFLAGKKSSDESKKESNRFEAFGIKIDVNNPSLILIMLGAVMMLSPKFMPQESTKTPLSDLEIAPPPAPSTSPSRESESVTDAIPPAEEIVTSPQTASIPPPTVTSPEQALPTATTALPVKKTLVAAPATQPATSTLITPPTPSAKEKAKPPPPKKVSKSNPVASKPKPVTPEVVAVAAPPPLDTLVVATVADVSKQAGISESAEAYAKRASEAIARQAGEIFSDSLRVARDSVADLRAHLPQGVEDYKTLCKTWKANILILGDFRITTGWSSIDSAYWPDYHLHLYNCDTQRARYAVFKHLNPSNRDIFPFQQAINEKTMRFLSESRWIVNSN